MEENLDILREYFTSHSSGIYAKINTAFSGRNNLLNDMAIPAKTETLAGVKDRCDKLVGKLYKGKATPAQRKHIRAECSKLMSQFVEDLYDEPEFVDHFERQTTWSANRSDQIDFFFPDQRAVDEKGDLLDVVCRNIARTSPNGDKVAPNVYDRACKKWLKSMTPHSMWMWISLNPNIWKY